MDDTSRPRGMEYCGAPVLQGHHGNDVMPALSPLALAAYRQITHITTFFEITFIWICECVYLVIYLFISNRCECGICT